MLASPAEPLKIDWAAYKNKVAVPGLVDNFEKLYSAIKIPYPEDKYSAAIDKHEKEIVINLFYYFILLKLSTSFNIYGVLVVFLGQRC